MDINKIDHAAKSVTSVITNPMYISYGFLGITSVILGYYTLFDNNIQKPVAEQPQPQPQPQPLEQEQEQPQPQPQEQPQPQPQPQNNPGIFGGKSKKLKKTKKHKSKK